MKTRLIVLVLLLISAPALLTAQQTVPVGGSLLTSIDTTLSTMSGNSDGVEGLLTTIDAVLDTIKLDTADIKTAIEGVFANRDATADAERVLLVDSAGAILTLASDYNVNDAAPTNPAGPTLMLERTDTLATLSEADADWTNPRTNNRGALWVAVSGTNTSGADRLKYTSVGTTEDEHAVCTGPCNLYSITATNTNAAVRYLRCENDTAANTTPGSETVELDLAIPGATTGLGFTTTFPVGATFGTALTCWTVTGAADTDVAEVAANEIKLFYTFTQ